MCRRDRRHPPHPPEFVQPIVPKNRLGFASFMTSLSGFLCGITFPLGFLMGLIALWRAPRAGAWAGTIIGGLGTAALGGLALLIAGSSEDECRPVRFDPRHDRTAKIVAQLEERIIDVEVERGAPLTEKEIQAWVASTRDGWDRPLRFEWGPDRSRLLVSAGRDGRFATRDDRRSILGQR